MDEEVVEGERCSVCGSTNIVREILPYTTEIDWVCVDCNVRKEDI